MLEVGVRCGVCGGDVHFNTCAAEGHDWALSSDCRGCGLHTDVKSGCLDCAALREERTALGQIRQTHHYGFRSGEWADLLATVESYGRDCYLVKFADGVTDWWPTEDEHAGYEFR